ncbi:MAG: hypothetical protein L0312_06790, partial [Acidobacteria bacterium]|nr:hypothetical protein [Acidobacteriota bacterium]
KDPSQKAYAIANMTGANRVLIGIGWALVAIVYYFKHRRKDIPIDDSQGLELSLLLLATTRKRSAAKKPGSCWWVIQILPATLTFSSSATETSS